MLNNYQPEFKQNPGSGIGSIVIGILFFCFLMFIAGCYANNHTPQTRPEPEGYNADEHPEYERPSREF